MLEIKRYNTRPKKSLGQNYLTDDNICKNIVNAFDIKDADCVLEIGPGQGAITKYILERSPNYIGVELDRNNVELLTQKFPGINILNEDFLNVRIENILKSKFKIQNPKVRIIGNIPYNITTEIVFKLIDNRNIISDAQLMIQEEVAQRLTASPHTKEYGIPTVFAQVFSKPEILFKVSRNCFYPKPKVDSRVIQFDFSRDISASIKDIDFFKKFVKSAFGNRRKIMKNSLMKMELDLTKVDFDFSRRAETVSVDEYIELSNKLNPSEYR